MELVLRKRIGDPFCNISVLAGTLENRSVRSIKFGEVVCETESDFLAVCSLVSLPSLDRWNIESLQLEMWNANPWKHLSKTSWRGSIMSFTVGGDQYVVRYWVSEEVEAVKTGIEELCFEQHEVVCLTNERVKILCIVLALAQQWSGGSEGFLCLRR